jgi:hypothetical protein
MVVNSYGYYEMVPVLNFPVFNFQPEPEPEPEFQFQDADWLTEGGLVTHHLRVYERGIEEATGRRTYTILDTRLQDQFSSFKVRYADDVEANAKLYHRSSPEEIPGIKARMWQANGVAYSILKCTDCESLQRWIQTGRHEDRWSPQVVGWAVAGGVGLLIALTGSKEA